MPTLTTTLSLDAIVKAPNVAEQLTPQERADIAQWVIAGYDNDKGSRKDWEERNGDALKLALQVREDKSEPWDGCSNVKFPLVTMAVLHYHARAYPLLVSPDDLVNCKVYGADPDGSKAERARRIGQHMTWQNIEQMPEWESEHDKALLIQGILGVAVKKRYFDPVRRRQASCVIGVDNFVVSYFTRGDVNEAPRATHVMEMWPNDVHERVVRGVFCSDKTEDDVEEQNHDGAHDPAAVSPAQEIPRLDAVTEVANERTGNKAPGLDMTAPIAMLEQMCWLDLDDDGYDEPYFATVEQATGVLRRLVARFTSVDVVKQGGKVVAIHPEAAYTKYGLIPAPDGSWYDIGFGHLLGPINHSVDTALNQMFDAGTMSTTGGGFLGRGARLKAGQQRFKPFEWKTVDSTGDDLRKNIVALDIKEPSRVLLELMMFLVQYSEGVASANDLQTGENIGQNTPAETARTMNQNGARIFSAIYKRTWRAMRDEFRIQFALNRAYLVDDECYADIVSGAGGMVTVQDYQLAKPFICPSADPNIVSEADLQRQAAMVMQTAMTVPGFNRHKSIRRWLQAMRIPAIDEIFPPLPQGQPDLPSPPDPKLLQVQMKGQELQLKHQNLMGQLKLSMMEFQTTAAKIKAEILELQARSVMELAQAKGVDQGHQIALIDAMIGAKKQSLDGVTQLIGTMTDHISTMREFGNAGNDQPSSDGSGSGSMDGASDNPGVFSLPAAGGNGAAGGMGGGQPH
jgi:chaperonin GroES